MAIDSDLTDPIPPAPKPPPRRFSLLYGPNGLRPGWGILLFIAVGFVLQALLGTEMVWFAGALHLDLGTLRSGELHPALTMLAEANTLLAVVLATALMAKLEGRQTNSYGLAGSGRFRQFFLGLLSGFLALSLLVEILVTTHHLTLAFTHPPAMQALRYAAAWGVICLLVGLTEEMMFRGYVLFTLARGLRFWPAVVALAVAFGMVHGTNTGESHVGLVAAGLIALLFSLSLWRLGHLSWAIGFHTSWDWAQSYFYGTPDSGAISAGRLMEAHPAGSVLLSGGLTGPEGSLWILPVLVLVAVVVWITQPYRGIQLDSK